MVKPRFLRYPKVLLLFFFSVLLSLFLHGTPAYSTAPGEYSIKAAYLYNFAKFVEWPAPTASDSTFTIGIMGDDPFGKELQAVFAGKTVQDKPVTIRYVNTTAEAARCQIIFISASEDDRLDRILSDLNGTPVLTVGETPRFFQQGGIVRFQMLRHSVRFNINLQPAEVAHLKISSQLLKVANYVQGAPPNAP